LGERVRRHRHDHHQHRRRQRHHVRLPPDQPHHQQEARPLRVQRRLQLRALEERLQLAPEL
jgi:hypothetical protein